MYINVLSKITQLRHGLDLANSNVLKVLKEIEKHSEHKVKKAGVLSFVEYQTIMNIVEEGREAKKILAMKSVAAISIRGLLR